MGLLGFGFDGRPTRVPELVFLFARVSLCVFGDISKVNGIREEGRRDEGFRVFSLLLVAS